MKRDFLLVFEVRFTVTSRVVVLGDSSEVSKEVIGSWKLRVLGGVMLVEWRGSGIPSAGTPGVGIPALIRVAF